MKTFIKLFISIAIQVIFLIIAIGLSHTFPSLGIIPYWVLGFTSGMIVILTWNEIDNNERLF